jgi:hypothetical protein
MRSSLTALITGIFLSLAAHASGSDFQLAYHGEFRTLESPRLWNLMTLGFRLDPRFQIEAQAQTELSFQDQARLQVGDPRFGVSGLVANHSNWWLWGNLNLEVPWSKGNPVTGRGLAPGSFQMFQYYPPGGRLGFGVEHWFRFYRFSDDRPWWDIQGNFSPTLLYQAAPKLVAETRVSINYFHVKDRGWQLTRGQDVALEPGLSWNPTPTLNLRPYLSLQSAGAPLSGPISAGLWITGRMQ